MQVMINLCIQPISCEMQKSYFVVFWEIYLSSTGGELCEVINSIIRNLKCSLIILAQKLSEALLNSEKIGKPFLFVE